MALTPCSCVYNVTCSCRFHRLLSFWARAQIQLNMIHLPSLLASLNYGCHLKSPCVHGLLNF